MYGKKTESVASRNSSTVRRARAIAFTRATINKGGFFSPSTPADATAALHAVDLGMCYPITENGLYGYRSNYSAKQLDAAVAAY